VTGHAPSRVVVLRALGVGDLCTAVPALRAVRRARRGAEITLATPAVLAPLVRLVGAVGRLAPVEGLDGPLPSELAGCDVAINLHGTGPQSTRLLAALRPRRLLTYAGPEHTDGPGWCDDEHEVDRWCRLVETGLGGFADRADLRLPCPPEAGPGTGPAVVHVGASSVARRWPVERFAVIVRHLSRLQIPVVLTGTRPEQAAAAAVRRLAGPSTGAHGRVTSVAGRTRLAQLLTIVASARLVVSGDTGVAHLATAFGVPSVVLFGPTSPERWGPRIDGPHTVLWSGRTGDPHGNEPDPGLLDLGVDEVVAAVDERLGYGATTAEG
jgi:ADP-heptose:LPS heptosyltransferase